MNSSDSAVWPLAGRLWASRASGGGGWGADGNDEQPAGKDVEEGAAEYLAEIRPTCTSRVVRPVSLGCANRFVAVALGWGDWQPGLDGTVWVGEFDVNEPAAGLVEGDLAGEGAWFCGFEVASDGVPAAAGDAGDRVSWSQWGWSSVATMLARPEEAVTSRVASAASSPCPGSCPKAGAGRSSSVARIALGEQPTGGRPGFAGCAGR